MPTIINKQNSDKLQIHKKRSTTRRKTRMPLHTRRHWLLWTMLLCGGFALITLLWSQYASRTTHLSSTPITHTPLPPLQIGNSAPDFQLSAINGQPFRLSEQKGQIILLSFLTTVPDNTDSPSRRQVVSLISMYQQYHSRGVEVVIIDITGIHGETPPTLDTLINVSYDWHLGSLPLLRDTPAYTTANLYTVEHTPTTFLINSAGLVVQRWNGMALSAQLALHIQQVLKDKTRIN